MVSSGYKLPTSNHCLASGNLQHVATCHAQEPCRLQSQVEELQRTKPAQPLLAGPPSAFLDTLGISTSSISTGGPSKFDAFTKKFKQGLEEFINADLSAPLPPQQQAHYQQQQMQQPPMQQGQSQPQQQQGMRGAAANGAKSADGASPRATRDYTGSPQPATAPGNSCDAATPTIQSAGSVMCPAPVDQSCSSLNVELMLTPSTGQTSLWSWSTPHAHEAT